MFSLRPRKVFLYLFSTFLLGFVFAAFYSSVNKPEIVAAAHGSCSISVYLNGSNPLSIRAVMTVSIPDARPGSGLPGWPSTDSPWIPYLTSPGANYYHTYSSGGGKTVNGRYSYVPSGSSVRVPIECSRGFTLSNPPPINRPPTGSVSGSCDAATGVLNVRIDVSDPDGGIPGWSMSIAPSWYIPSAWGSQTVGPYNPPRDGVSYSLIGTVVDPRTGGRYDIPPGSYVCPAPPPPQCPSPPGSGPCAPPTCQERDATNFGGALPCTYTPPTCSLSVNPTPVAPNGTSTLSWSSTDATAFTVDQGVGALSPVGSGQRTVNPGASTKTYTGTATGRGGSIICRTTLTVAPAPTCNLSVNPTPVAPNGTSTLSWSSTNATTFTVDQGVGALSPVGSGQRTVNPGASTKTYTGTATGAGGSVNCRTTLTVASFGCSIIGATIEPGSYTPQISVIYSTDASAPNATVGSSLTIDGITRTVNGTSVPPNTPTTISFAPVDLAVGTYPVSASVSGTVSGVGLPNAACGGAVNILVVIKPYFKVFNGGATVGAGFNSGTTTCTTAGAGQVSGFANNNPLRGSSTQYDLKALSSVATTFYSSGDLPPAVNYKALTFANNVAADTYGGNFGGQKCLTDYYTTTRNATMPTDSGVAVIASLNAQAGPNNQIDWGGGRLNGGNLAAGGKLVVYVTGDVYITGNITLANNYNSLTDIPFFALVVRGNIMIAPGVTTLDGLYIAQPNGGSGGTIYTCATSINTIPASNAIYDTCRTKLTFNGSVVAKSIKLLRTIGTLSQAPAAEPASSANIAEVFNGMPELFIANPAFKIDETTAELYDSITILPPLL